MKHGSITTGRGDGGETSLPDGTPLPKDHPRIEALGLVDTFRISLSLLRIRLLALPEEKEQADFLFFLLHACFALGAEISGLSPHAGSSVPTLKKAHLQRLEKEQARLEQGLNLPPAFIATATNEGAALADEAATTIRTLERRMVACQKAVPPLDVGLSLAFVNRLSDYLFILARHLEKGHHETVDYRILDLSDD